MLPLAEPVSAVSRVVETVIPAALIVPLTRLFRIEGFLRSFPRIAAALIALIAGYLAGLVLLALRFPALLPALDALAIILIAAAYWFSRPNFGSSRGLPPGSLSIVASLEAIFDHRFYLNQARRHGPVFKMLQFHQPVVCVVGFKKGHELIRLPDDVLAPAPQPFSAEIPGGFLRYMDARTHAIYAPKFLAAFSPRVTNASEPVIRQAVREELNKMAENSASRPGVHPGGYLYRAMFVSFARIIFGFPPRSDALRSFRSGCELFDAQDISRPLSPGTREVLSDLRDQILRQVDRVSGDPPVPCVLTEWLRAEPGTLDRTALDNLIFLFRIGVHNVSSLLRWVFKMLADHPEFGERVRQEGPDLAQRIVMETLRLEQSEYLYRTVKSSLTIDDHRIPAGWIFRLCVRESHRDPGIFDDAERFNPDRFLSRKGDRPAYAPFGTDRHACIAVHASYAAARIFVEELAQNYCWTVTEDGPRERLPRHWHHWEPSSRFSLSLNRTATEGVSVNGHSPPPFPSS